MIARFAFVGLQPIVRRRNPTILRAGETVSGAAPIDAQPLQALLKALRGSVIGILTKEREVEGKLVQSEPITLIAADGTTTIVTLGQVLSVRF